MNFGKIIGAAVLGVSAATAQAAGPGDLGTIDDLSVVIGNVISERGFFTDSYTFTIEGEGDLTGSAQVLSVGDTLGIRRLTVSLLDSDAMVIGTDSRPRNGFSFVDLAPGDYTLRITGRATGLSGGTYSGAIFADTTTVPIPEPETYALMLAGLAAVGFIARRRRQQA
jgi:hypothetical protein